MRGRFRRRRVRKGRRIRSKRLKRYHASRGGTRL